MKEEYGNFRGKKYRYLRSLDSCKEGILLMHGYSFYAEIWNECGLTNVLDDLSYHTVSIDVPGYPNSKSGFQLGEMEFGPFLDSVIESSYVGKPVLLGASASGYLALRYASGTEKIRAVIAVGPVNIESIDLQSIEIPILAIWGTNDTVSDPGGREIVKSIRHSVVELIEGAGHACYLDKPNDFNIVVYNLLSTL